MEKIFTTFDGIDIFKGDKYFTFSIINRPITDKFLNAFNPKFRSLIINNNPNGFFPKFRIAGPYINPKAHEPSGEILYFAKKENAEEYIRNHEHIN